MKDKLIRLRKEKGLLQKEIASKIGITKSAYSNYEQGIRQPPYEILKKICAIYDVTSDYLLGLEDEFGNKIENKDETIVKVVARSPGNKVKPHYEKLTPEDIKFFEEILAKLKK